jgi:hypothetical protein
MANGCIDQDLLNPKGHFSTQLFERHQRSEKALVSALAEICVQGVSTRKMKAITEELCGQAFSASTISAINRILDESLEQFANRPLEEIYPCLIAVRPPGSGRGAERPGTVAGALGEKISKAVRVGRGEYR